MPISYDTLSTHWQKTSVEKLRRRMRCKWAYYIMQMTWHCGTRGGSPKWIGNIIRFRICMKGCRHSSLNSLFSFVKLLFFKNIPSLNYIIIYIHPRRLYMLSRRRVLVLGQKTLTGVLKCTVLDCMLNVVGVTGLLWILYYIWVDGYTVLAVECLYRDKPIHWNRFKINCTSVVWFRSRWETWFVCGIRILPLS